MSPRPRTPRLARMASAFARVIRPGRPLKIAALAWLGMLIATGAWSQTETEPTRSLRVGMLGYQGEDRALERWSETMAYMQRHIPSLRFELLPLTLGAMAEALDAGDLDLVFTNPGHYVQSAKRHRLAPLATLRSDRPGGPVTGNRFGAVIFTRADHPGINSLADLAGARFAAVAPEAFGGFLIGADTLARNGLNWQSDLGDVLFLGFPQSSIVDAVLAGKADAGTVRTGLIEAMIARGQIRQGEVRVLNAARVPGFDFALSSALVPEWTVAATPRLGPDLRRRIVVALLSMDGSDPAAVLGGYGGWDTPMAEGAVRDILARTAALNGSDRGARDSAGSSRAPIAIALGLAGLAIAALFAVAMLWARGGPGRGMPAATTDGESGSGALPHLTPREREILSQIEHGSTSKQIARDLGISPKTVEYHRGHIMKKFGASTMAEVVHRHSATPTEAAQDSARSPSQTQT